MGFEVLTAASMKMAVFWIVAPCSLVEVYRHFRSVSCLHRQGPDIWRQQAPATYNPENSLLQFFVKFSNIIFK
jgi:hypothetical protein